MALDLEAEQGRLQAMTVGELKDEFVRVWGWRHPTNNRTTLVRRILWRMSNEPLSPEAVARAREIADQVLVRDLPPPNWPERAARDAKVRSRKRDPRLPPVGTVLRREYRGEVVAVTIGADDFEYKGQKYRSLSAVANEVTGSRWNGLRFFGLTQGTG